MSKVDSQPNHVAEIAKSSSNSFAVLKQITAACHAVQNVVFVAPDPKPEWFASLDSKLKDAQHICGQWIDIEPELTGNIPTQIINAYGLFSEMRKQAILVLNQNPDTPFSGPDDPRVKTLRDMIGKFRHDISRKDLDPVASVDAMQHQLKTWGGALQDAHDALKSGTVSIQDAETDLKSDIDKFRSGIELMNTEIDAYNKAFEAGIGAMVAGVVIAVVAVSIAPEAAAVSVPAMATAGLLFAGGAVVDGVFQAKIDSCFDTIAADQKGITADQAQIVALNGLSAAASQAVRGLEDATSRLSDLRTSWSALKSGLDQALHDLDEIVKDEEPSAFMDRVYLGGSQEEWKSATDLAEKLQTMDFSVVTMPIKVTRKAA